MNKQMKKVLCTALTGAMLLGSAMPALALTMGEETSSVGGRLLSGEEMLQAQPRSMGIDFHDGTWLVHEMKNYEEEFLDPEMWTYSQQYKNILERYAYTEENGKPVEYVEIGRKDLPLDLGNVVIHDVQFIRTEAGPSKRTEYLSYWLVNYEPKVPTFVTKNGITASFTTVGALSRTGHTDVGITSNLNSVLPYTEHINGYLQTAAAASTVISYGKPGEPIWNYVSIYHNGGDSALPIFFVADKNAGHKQDSGLPEEQRYQVKGCLFHDEDVSYRVAKEEVLIEVPTTPEAVEQSSGFSININGATITLGTKLPYIEEGTTMVPVRIISEALGLDVAWDEDKQLVTLTNANNEKVDLVIGQNALTSTFTDKGEIELLQPAVIVNGSTYLPLRAISEALGCDVDYASVEGTNVISILS